MRTRTQRICGIAVALLVGLTAPCAGYDLIWAPAADVIGEIYGRGLHAAGEIDDRIYVAGGGFIGASLWGSYDSVVVYDPVADAWSFRAPMPTQRAAPGGAVARYLGQERLYVIGGADLTGFPIDHFTHPDIEEYDPVSDSWRTVGAGMPTSAYTWGTCAVTHDNLIYIMGGTRDSFGDATTRLTAYDPDTDSYATLDPVPVGVSDGACAVVGDFIYYFGGFVSGGWGQPPNTQVFVYDIVGDSWQTATTPMPEPRANAAAIAIVTEVYVVGGWDGSGTYFGLFNTVDVYDTMLDQWTVDIPNVLGCVEDDLSTVRGRAGLTLHTAFDGDFLNLYAIGGNIGISVPTRCNETAPLIYLGPIFSDGFESGTTDAWSDVVP